MDIMFYEVFKEEEIVLKKFLPKTIQAGFTWKTIQEYDSPLIPAQLISIRTQSRIPREWGKKLDGVLTRATGYDHILAYRRQIKNKIPAGYLPDYSSRAVAEHAVLVAWALLRKLRCQEAQFENFNRDHLTGRECRGKNLLVVGVGHIGEEIVHIGQALSMNVKGVDIKKGFKRLPYVSLAQGVRWADVLMCALPLTPLTKKMLNYKTLKAAKKGLILVNVSRGEITPSRDLKHLLDEGILGGVGLDVYEKENHLADYLRGHSKKIDPMAKIILALKERDDVIFTPHNAFNTHESVERKARESINSIVMFLRNRKFPYPVPEI